MKLSFVKETLPIFVAPMKEVVMSQSTSMTFPAPALCLGGTTDKWQQEYEAFLRLKPQLQETHVGKYVVIHQGQVVDIGTDDVALAMRFFGQHGNVPVHIGLVADRPDLIGRIPHYREAAAGK